MADPNTRQGKRTPVTLKIKFKSETLEQFIERYAVDVSQGGIFIRTKEPLAVGTQMRFEFQLRDASPLIAGEGTVVWTRENDPSRPAIAPGMGVRFDRLAEGSQGVLERILMEKLKQAPQRPNTEPTKPPMFTDTPTRVAPLPVQEALLGGSNRSDSSAFSDQGTPLPRPMPFHSDAEDFDEGAFEEATKVRALDELIAQTAGNDDATTQTPLPDRGGRADSTVSDPPRASSLAEPAYKPPVDRDSAPVLPSPPEAASRAQPKLLDTTPSPRTETPAPVGETKTRLGVEPPAKSPVRASTPPANVAKEAPAKQPVRAVAKDSSPKLPAAPESTKSSAAPLVILLLLLVAAGGAAVWFFVLREKAVENVATQGPTTNTGSDGSAVQTGSDGSAGSAAVALGSDSAGSAVGSDGSAGSAGSAAVVAPTGDLVDTVIASSVDKATVEVIGTPLTGPAPFKAKLEKGKAYKARVQAPGFAPLEVDVKGGDSKVTAKLVAKPRTIKVTSQPPGAAILIDGMNTGKTTPFDVELTRTQAAKKSVRVMLQKRGFRSLERMVDTSKYTEDVDKMIATLDEKLAVQVFTNTGGNTGGTKPNTGSGTTAGSAGTTTGSAGTTTGSAGTTTGSAGTTTGSAGTGSGSTTPSPLKDGPKPTGSGSGTGSGSATTPTTPPKPAEPEPDFMRRQ